MISNTVEMSPGELEKVLRHLPEPSYASFYLSRFIDYSSFLLQFQEIIKKEGIEKDAELNLSELFPIRFKVKNIPKNKIIEIYKKSRQPLDDKSSLPGSLPPIRVKLSEVNWDLESKVKIELTPSEVEVKIKYKGKEPDYIPKMIKELEGTNVQIKIEPNCLSFY